jgi:uncharacterized membrane protein YcaP (DUF421 family)
MSPENIKWHDWPRIFFGELPPVFFIEVALRTFFCYILLVLALRILGKRVAAQLNRNEFTTIVSLAAAVGVPILAPDKGLLPAGVIALIIVLISKGIAYLSARKRAFEKASQGEIAMIVENGVIAYARTKKIQLTKNRIFAQLRSEGITHLGQVAYLYMEPTGKFSLIKRTEPVPGLTTLPEYDKAFRDMLRYNHDIMVCCRCGRHFGRDEVVCTNCGGTQSAVAVEG